MSINISIWDTCGQERFHCLTKTYYRGSDGCLLVYDVTDSKSFQGAKRWLNDIKQNGEENTMIMLIGNKTDLSLKREVSTEKAEQFAIDNGLLFYETSAKNGANVHKAFNDLAFTIYCETISHSHANSRIVFKFILLGDSGVGKTSLERRYMRNRFDCYQRSTIGASFSTKQIKIPGGENMKFGFSVNGSKDTSNFRECIKNRIVPRIESITSESLFYDYYFDHISKNNNDNINDCDGLFYPSFCWAKTNNDTYYISVGLGSNLRENCFERDPLNLMIILDISGSMNYCFSGDNISQIEISKQCIINLLDKHLNHKLDRFGLIIFNDSSVLIQKLEYLNKINICNLKKQICNIKASGGTNIICGYNMAIQQYNNLNNDMIDFDEFDEKETTHSNRIIFLTDANIPKQSKDAINLLKLNKKLSEERKVNKVYSSFIGIGIDFDTDLISDICKVRGSNYLSVHSNDDFIQKMNEEFDFLVSPILFDLKLTLKFEGDSLFQIDKVYGTNQDRKNTEIINIKTLFLSKPNENERCKGGIIVIKLKKKNKNIQNNNINIQIMVNYENKNGTMFEKEHEFVMMNDKDCYFDNIDIRKGILLSNYFDVLQKWIQQKKHKQRQICQQYEKHEIPEFINHFKTEIKAIRDDTLKQEIKVLNKLRTCRFSHVFDSQHVDISNQHNHKIQPCQPPNYLVLRVSLFIYNLIISFGDVLVKYIFDPLNQMICNYLKPIIMKIYYNWINPILLTIFECGVYINGYLKWIINNSITFVNRLINKFVIPLITKFDKYLIGFVRSIKLRILTLFEFIEIFSKWFVNGCIMKLINDYFEIIFRFIANKLNIIKCCLQQITMKICKCIFSFIKWIFADYIMKWINDYLFCCLKYFGNECTKCIQIASRLTIKKLNNIKYYVEIFYKYIGSFAKWIFIDCANKLYDFIYSVLISLCNICKDIFMSFMEWIPYETVVSLFKDYAYEISSTIINAMKWIYYHIFKVIFAKSMELTLLIWKWFHINVIQCIFNFIEWIDIGNKFNYLKLKTVSLFQYTLSFVYDPFYNLLKMLYSQILNALSLIWSILYKMIGSDIVKIDFLEPTNKYEIGIYYAKRSINTFEMDKESERNTKWMTTGYKEKVSCLLWVKNNRINNNNEKQMLLKIFLMKKQSINCIGTYQLKSKRNGIYTIPIFRKYLNAKQNECKFKVVIQENIAQFILKFIGTDFYNYQQFHQYDKDKGCNLM